MLIKRKEIILLKNEIMIRQKGQRPIRYRKHTMFVLNYESERDFTWLLFIILGEMGVKWIFYSVSGSFDSDRVGSQQKRTAKN